MRTLLCAVVLFCAPSGIHAQKSTDSDSVSKIIALENVWNEAVEIKDLKALNAVLDDAFVYVESDGKLLTKDDLMAYVKTSLEIQGTSESMVVHLHGDTAVVTGIYATKVSEHGKAFVRRELFVDTWRQKDGVWMSIASLTTPAQR